MSLIERQRPRFATHRLFALVIGVIFGVMVFEVSHCGERDSHDECVELSKRLSETFPALDAVLTEGPEKDSGKNNLYEIKKYAERARERGRSGAVLEPLRLGIDDVLTATVVEGGLQSQRGAQWVARGLASVQRSVNAFEGTCRQ